MSATDVLCIGETMAAITPIGAGIERADVFAVHPAGAESNVAHALAGLGHRAAWASVLGADPLGNRVLAAVRDGGVDVSLVRRNPDAPTGVMFKDPGAHETTVHYYRRHSAAASMGPELIAEFVALEPAIVHLSGVTSALSDSCAELVRRIVLDRAIGPALVAFDVNFRPRLWAGRDAATALLELARAADVVLVGRDEAALLWSTATADDVRALLPDVPTLLVKDAAIGATAYRGPERVFVESPRVPVVENVGAGDAFAAGWVSGRLRGLGPKSGLRLAHLSAGTVLRSVGDQAAAPPPAEIERMLALDDDDWRSLHLPSLAIGTAP